MCACVHVCLLVFICFYVCVVHVFSVSLCECMCVRVLCKFVIYRINVCKGACIAGMQIPTPTLKD